MFLRIFRSPDSKIVYKIFFSVICYLILNPGFGQLQGSKNVYLKNDISNNPDIWYFFGDELFSFLETTENTLYAYVANDGSFEEKAIGLYQRFYSGQDKTYGGQIYTIVDGDWAIRVNQWGAESGCDNFDITCDYGVSYNTFGNYDPTGNNFTGRFYALDIDQLNKTGLGGNMPLYTKKLVEYECLECATGWVEGTSAITCGGTVTPKTIQVVLVVLNPVYGTTEVARCEDSEDMYLIRPDSPLLFDDWPGQGFEVGYGGFISDITTDQGDHDYVEGDNVRIDVSEHGSGIVGMNVTWRAPSQYYLNRETDYVTVQEFDLGEIYPVPDIEVPGAIILCDNSGLIDLPDGSPVGGDWSGSHVAGGQFDSNAAEAGDYMLTYTYTNADGCTATAEMVVTLEAVAVSTLDDLGICAGESVALTVFATATTDERGDDVSYEWAPSAGLSATVGRSVLASPSVTTTYMVTGTSANGCEGQDEVVVTVYDLPDVDVTSTAPGNAICENEPFILSVPEAGPGVSYSWTPSSRVDNPLIREPTAVISSGTEFRVRVTDDNGCESEGLLYISVHDASAVDAGSDQEICVGESIELSAQGIEPGVEGFSFYWEGPNIVDGADTDHPEVAPTVNSNYQLTVTDPNGCMSTDDVRVVVNVVAPNAGSDKTICLGESVQLNGSGGVSYSWIGEGLSDPDNASPTATPTSIGNHVYEVSVTSGDGCTGTDQVNVNVLSTPDLALPEDQYICKGESIVLRAEGAQSYDWSPSSGLNVTNLASVTASPTSTVVYTVEGMGVNGCVVEGQVVVYVNDPPEADAGSTRETCINEDLMLNGSATLGAGPYSYSWTGVGIVSGGDTATPVVNISSDQTYTLTVTDANGCTDLDEVDVRVNTLPNAVISVNDFVTTSADICRGEVVQLEAYGGGSYLWSGDAGLSNPMIQNPVITVDDTKVLDVVVTNSNGCVGTASITLNAVDNPVVDAGGVLELCVDGGLYDLRQGVNIQGGVFEGEGVVDEFLFDPGDAGVGIFLIDYDVTVGGCTGSDVREVRVKDNPVITLIEDVEICKPGGSGQEAEGVVLMAVGSWQGAEEGTGSYEWFPTNGLDDPFSRNPIATPLKTTTYTVTGTDANGCSGTASVMVTVNDLTVNAGVNQVICEGEEVMLEAVSSGQGAVTYHWSPVTGLNDESVTNPFASPLETTTYTVSATDVQGCTVTDEVTVTVEPRPELLVGSKLWVCESDPEPVDLRLGINIPGGEFSSESSGLEGVLYYGGREEPGIYFITYEVVVGGCEVSGVREVEVLPEPEVGVNGTEFSICGAGSTFAEATVDNSVELRAWGIGQWAESSLDYEWFPKEGLNDPFAESVVAMPLETTIYNVVITDENGCSTTRSFEVGVRDVDVFAGVDVTICGGERIALEAESSGHRAGSVRYSWSPGNSLSDATVSNPVASPLVTTTYEVMVTDSEGCSGTDEVTVFVDPAPDLEVGGVLTLCQHGDLPYDLRQDVTVQGGIFSSQSNGLVGVEFDPSKVSDPGIYFVEYAVEIDGCNVTRTREVRVKGDPMITSLFDSYDICAGEGIELRVESTFANQLRHHLRQGFGGQEGSVDQGATADESSGQEAVAYEWFPKVAINNPLISSPEVSPVTDQTYTVVATSAYGCTSSLEIDVRVMDFEVDAGRDVEICEGEAVTLEALSTYAKASVDESSVISHEWFPEYGISDPFAGVVVASPSETTTYTVRVMSADGCVGEDEVTVTVLDNPELSFVMDEIVVCEDVDVMDLNIGARGKEQGAQSGAEIDFRRMTWEGVGVSETGLFDPGESGVGTFVVSARYEDAAGCSDESYLVVRVPRKPAVDAGPDLVVCQSDSLVLLTSGGSPEGGVFAGAGVEGDYFLPGVAGSGAHAITYVYTDPVTGCSSSDVREVMVLRAAAVFAGPPVSLCIDAGPLDLSLGVSPEGGIFEAERGVNGHFFYPSSGIGKYRVEYSIVDEYGCKSSAERVITVNDRPELVMAEDLVEVCSNAGVLNLNAYPNISGGTWSGSPGIVNGLVKVDSLGIGSNILSYAVNTSDGCSLSTELIVQVAGVQELALGGTISTCLSGDPVDLLGNFNRELVTVSGPGVVDAVFDPGLVERGTYEAVYRYENSNGCVAEQRRVIVVQGEVFVSTVGEVSVCQNFGDVVLAGYGFPEGGVWSGANVGLGVFDAIQADVGDYEVVYTIDLGLGCENSDTLVIHVAESDLSGFGTDTIVCVNGPEVLLNFSEELSGGTWSGAGVVNNIFYPSEAGVGSWELSYSNDGLSCDVAGSRTVRVVDVPPKAMTETYAISGCVGDIVRLTADLVEQGGSGQVNYAWYYEGEGKPFAMGKSIDFRIRDSENIYFVSVNAFGCEAVERDFIRVSANGPVGDFAVDKDSVGMGELLRFEAFGSNVEAYYWEMGDGNYSELKNPLYYYYSAGWHTVRLTMRSPDGCESVVVKEDLVFVRRAGEGEGKVLGAEGTEQCDVVVRPNPSGGVFTVDLPGGLVGAEVSVYSLDGRRVDIQTFGHSDVRTLGRGEIGIDMSGEPGGTYLLAIAMEGGVVYRKVVVMK